MSAGCWCCGKLERQFNRDRVHAQWEGRMDGYCYDCALARCDAFPGECPNRRSSGVSKEGPA